MPNISNLALKNASWQYWQRIDSLEKVLDLKRARLDNGLRLFEDGLAKFREVIERHVTLSSHLDAAREEIVNRERQFHKTNRDLVVKATLLECVRQAMRKFRTSVASGEAPELPKELNILNAQEMDLPQGTRTEPRSVDIYYLKQDRASVEGELGQLSSLDETTRFHMGETQEEQELRRTARELEQIQIDLACELERMKKDNPWIESPLVVGTFGKRAAPLVTETLGMGAPLTSTSETIDPSATTSESIERHVVLQETPEPIASTSEVESHTASSYSETRQVRMVETGEEETLEIEVPKVWNESSLP